MHCRFEWKARISYRFLRISIIEIWIFEDGLGIKLYYLSLCDRITSYIGLLRKRITNKTIFWHWATNLTKACSELKQTVFRQKFKQNTLDRFFRETYLPILPEARLNAVFITIENVNKSKERIDCSRKSSKINFRNV